LHQSHDVVDGVMVHPFDGEAWKYFNNVHPHFSTESRNVHLGLCIDGFNPFGSFIARYSCWQIILMVYNWKFPGFGLTHNWIKRSIFWELPYWKTNLLRHNLDVMHIEKNMFGKTKYNIKARMDITLFCQRKNMELVYVGSWITKPKSSFALDNNA
jgi:hypothetical protein